MSSSPKAEISSSRVKEERSCSWWWLRLWLNRLYVADNDTNIVVKANNNDAADSDKTDPADADAMMVRLFRTTC